MGISPSKKCPAGARVGAGKEVFEVPREGTRCGFGADKMVDLAKKTKNLNVTAPYMSIKGCSELFPALNPANRGVFYWPLSRRKNF